MRLGRILCFILSALLVLMNIGCSDDVEEALELIDDDVADAVDGLPRKTIDYSRMGVNSFVNDQRFGGIDDQLVEVRDVLKLSFVRVLFAWNDDVQPAPDAQPNFSFYDEIAAGIPAGVDALVVVTGVPSWVGNSANWVGGNPRTTFVELWFRKVVERYAGRGRIIGWQVWNEPNDRANPQNELLGLPNSAANYVELLARAHSIAKDRAPSKLVLNAASTAINQNYPDTLNYNRSMRDAGAQEFVDVWAAHYYGRQYENVVRDNGVRSFLNGLSRAIWITESGRQGLDQQIAYVETTWPFLRQEIPGIDRIYYYQHTEATPSESSYALRNLERVSNLYINLRDR